MFCPYRNRVDGQDAVLSLRYRNRVDGQDAVLSLRDNVHINHMDCYCYNYGRKHNRLREYDYSLAGYYFVTLCTYKRVEFFGQIRNGQLNLNESGVLAHKFWKGIPFYYKNAGIDEFVVMPNHIHAIIILNDNAHAGTEHCFVRIRCGLLSKIIKSYKNVVTTHLRKNMGYYDFAWQRSFYDHIIRSEKALYIIREYIRDNPQKWEYDENNPLNIQKVINLSSQFMISS